MSCQPHNQWNADPFAVQPLPKSFYFPSPSKDVDKREAIHSPERKHQLNKRTAAEEQFLLGSNTYKASALPNVKSLGVLTALPTHDTSAGVPAESDNFDEAWPCSEGSRDVSTDIGTDMSAFSEGGRFDSENQVTNERHSVNVPYPGCSVVKDTLSQDGRTDSVLQRYIDRFRNSAPKSREERLKEREQGKKEFWWLERSSPEENKMPEKEFPMLQNSSVPVERHKVSLTREALLAMDEETAELQKKADKLLSQSELSFASSGPIVSTEGLGTSTSLSEFSVAEEQLPYRPAFVNIQERTLRSGVQVLPMRGAHVQKQVHESSKATSDDVLTRWRLRRKMEDALKQSVGAVQPQTAKHPTLDPRLEEFRKKLFAQKALIIQHDIDYERQKMKLLLEESDDSVGKVSGSQKIVESEFHVTPGDVTDDPVLRRLRQVTCGNQDTHSRQNVTSSHHMKQQSQEATNKEFLSCGDDNANNVQKPSSRIEDHSIEPVVEGHRDVNNTASSTAETDLYGNNPPCDEISIDNFDTQVVCDPRQKSYNLKSGQSSAPGVHKTCSQRKPPTHNFAQSVEDVEKTVAAPVVEPCAEDVEAHPGVKNTRGRPQHDAMSEKSFTSDKGEGREEKKEKLVHHGSSCSDKVSPRSDHIFHQVLEAEKPSEEGRQPSGVSSDREGSLSVSVSGSDVSFGGKQSGTRSKVGKHRQSKKPHKAQEVTRSEAEKSEVPSRSRRSRRRDNYGEGGGTDTKSEDSDVLTSVSSETDKTRPGANSRQKLREKKTSDVDHVDKLITRNNESRSSALRPSEQEVAASKLPIIGPPSSRSPAVSRREPMQAAIGQAITDHLFDGSAVISSVDSWASMFPQSPAQSRSLQETVLTTPSPQRHNRAPRQSTPLSQDTVLSQVPENAVDSSDGEFEDDPLLVLLRQQRAQYLEQLQLIDAKLQQHQAR